MKKAFLHSFINDDPLYDFFKDCLYVATDFTSNFEIFEFFYSIIGNEIKLKKEIQYFIDRAKDYDQLEIVEFLTSEKKAAF